MTDAAPASILYVGTLWHGGTALARCEALRELGREVVTFDTTDYLAKAGWFTRQLGFRLSAGPGVRRLNEDLLTLARSLPARRWVVWIDKGLWIYPDTVASLRRSLDAVMVHYTPDPQVVFQPEKLRHFLGAVPLYDVLFTTKPFEVDAYLSSGARNLILVHQSYDDRRLQPREVTPPDRQRLGSEVCFIGQYTDHYAVLLEAAVATGARVRFWGPNWRRRLSRHPSLRSAFAGDGVWGEDYAIALNATDIALCFLSKRYPESTTTRTFEIPGCGTFMLAERTPEHAALFREGEEAAFFGTPDELAAAIRQYLAHPAERRRIAAAGHARALRDGHGDRARMQAMLVEVDAVATRQARGGGVT